MLHLVIIAGVYLSDHCFHFQQDEHVILSAVIFLPNETDERRNNRHCSHGRVIYPIILRYR